MRLIDDDGKRCLSLPEVFDEEKYSMDPFTAASLGNSDLVDKALSRGGEYFQPDSCNGDGWTGLMYAAYLGHRSLLLSKGANVDKRNRRGQTALMLAAGCGNTGLVRLLLSRGAMLEWPR